MKKFTVFIAAACFLLASCGPSVAELDAKAASVAAEAAATAAKAAADQAAKLLQENPFLGDWFGRWDRGLYVYISLKPDKSLIYSESNNEITASGKPVASSDEFQKFVGTWLLETSPGEFGTLLLKFDTGKLELSYQIIGGDVIKASMQAGNNYLTGMLERAKK